MELKVHRVNLYDHFLSSSNLPELLTSFFGFLLRSARRSWAQVPFLRHSLCTLRQWKWRELLSLFSELTNQQTLYQIRTNQLKGVFRATISGVGWKFTSTPSVSWRKFFSPLKTFLSDSMFYLSKLALKGFHSHKDLLWFHKVSNVSSLKKFVTCTISSVVQSSSYSIIRRNLFFKSRASMNF